MCKLNLRLLLAGALAGLAGNSYAQACQQLASTALAADAARRQLLQQFISSCYQEHYFFQDKGVVELLTYRDGQGRENWYLSALIDDRYRDAPPRTYTMLGNTIILVYQADSTGRKQPAPVQEAASLNECLATVIGPAVYQRPTIKERYVEVLDAQGKPKKVRVQTLSGGNLHHERRILFLPDGTHKVFIPA